MTIGPNSDPVGAALAAAVSTTCEGLAFMEVMPLDEADDLDAGEPLVYAQVPCLAPRTGGLVIVCPRPAAAEIVSAVHSLAPEEVGDGLLRDTFGEMANTIAGCWLAALVAENETFTLGLPQTGVAPTAPVYPQRIVFGEDERAIFTVFFQLV